MITPCPLVSNLVPLCQRLVFKYDYISYKILIIYYLLEVSRPYLSLLSLIGLFSRGSDHGIIFFFFSEREIDVVIMIITPHVLIQLGISYQKITPQSILKTKPI